MSGDDSDSPGEITRLLVEWREGREAAPRLFSLVYQEMRGLARRQLRRGRLGSTLDTTSLVHEAYLRLVDRTRLDVSDRDHFFALASKAMRHILVDHARALATRKRGGDVVLTTIGDDAAPTRGRAEDVLAIDEALAKLEAIDPRLSSIVERKVFAGLSVEEIAASLGVSERTVKRDWRKARAFLTAELTRS